MIASWAFDVCFLAPLYTFLAVAAMFTITLIIVGMLSIFEDPAGKEKEAKQRSKKRRRGFYESIGKLPNRYRNVKQLYCANCGELVNLTKEAIRAAETASVYVRCGCGAVLSEKDEAD